MDKTEIQNHINRLMQFKKIEQITEAVATIPPLKIPGSTMLELLGVLTKHIQKNKRHDAIATLMVMMRADANWTISQLRRNGHLRSSKYGFQTAGLSKIAEAALKVAPIFSLKSEWREYLESVLALYAIGPAVRRMRASLLQRMEVRKRVVLKSLLSIVNYRFSSQYPGDLSLDSDDFHYWTLEHLASAFSLLFTLYKEEIGDVAPIAMHVDEQASRTNENIYASLLADAAKLDEFREAESLLDCLPYKAIAIGTDVTISAVDAAMEKCIRLGYIQTELQWQVRNILAREHFSSAEAPRPTMKELVEQAFSVGMGELVKLRKDPITRLVFELPMHEKFFEPFTGSGLLMEEVAMLYGTGIDVFEPDAGSALEITENLAAIEIVRAQRLFRLVDAVFSQKLETIADEKNRFALALRSTITVFNHEQLVMVLGKILPEEKVEPVIALLTLDANDGFVDIQYRPFIKIGTHYVVPPAIVAMSNLIRNIVVANRLRTAEQFVDDPMQLAVEQALVDAGFLAKQNVNLPGKLETDIVCWRDDELFIFECKNSYHPCSAHELRSSYRHLTKAASQLDLRLTHLSVAANQAQLFANLGWKVAPTTKIHTAIITANRMFSGYTIGGHPVRQAHELQNVLTRGSIDRGALPSLRFWVDEHFQTIDLVEYLQGRSIVEAQMSFLVDVNKTYKFSGASLAFKTYAMDLITKMHELEQRFPVQVSEEA